MANPHPQYRTDTTPCGWAVAGSNPGRSKGVKNVRNIGKPPAPNSVPYVSQHIDGRTVM